MRGFMGLFRKVWFWALLINFLYLPPYYLGSLSIEKFFLDNFIENWRGTSFLALVIITINQISSLAQSGLFVRLAEAGKRSIYITLTAWGAMFQTILLFSIACAFLAFIIILFYYKELEAIIPQLSNEFFASYIKLIFDVSYYTTIIVPIIFLFNGRFGVLLAIIQITLLEGISRLLQYLFPEFVDDFIARHFPQNFYAQFDLYSSKPIYLLGVIGYLLLFFFLSVLASKNLLKVKKV